MKRRYEQTVGGGWVAVLIPETQEDQEEIERMAMRGEVNDYASLGAFKQTYRNRNRPI
jgi:hypothetical protein